MGRCTKAEAQKRKRIVMKLLLKEAPRWQIVQSLSKRWGITERQVDNYISKAYKQIEKDVKRKRKAGVDYWMSKRLDLYNKAYTRNDLELCLSILQDIDKLEGNYTKKVDLTSGGDKIDFSEMTIEEIDNRIMELLN